MITHDLEEKIKKDRKEIEIRIVQKEKELDLYKRETQIGALDYKIKRLKYWWWYAVSDNIREMMSNLWKLIVKLANRPRKPQLLSEQSDTPQAPQVTSYNPPKQQISKTPTNIQVPVPSPSQAPQKPSEQLPTIDLTKLNELLGVK